MIGPFNLDERAARDFDRALRQARRKALRRRVAARLRGEAADDRLPSFEKARSPLGTRGPVRHGSREVEVEKIVGSIGRSRDFDRDFRPTNDSLRARWQRMARAFHCGEALPPVDLYKVGADYFVMDGNHRVSVARYMGAEMIDAVVKEFGPLRIGAKQ